MRLICGKPPEWLSNALSARGLVVCEFGCSKLLQKPVAHHIDLMAVKTADKLFITKEFEEKAIDFQIVLGNTNFTVVEAELSDKYPFDVPMNVVSVGDYLICNPKTAAKEILEYADKKRLKILKTAQGYTKCSTLIVDDSSIITEDESIYESVKDKLSVLKIEKGYVELPGYDYGFIGGASFADESFVYFFGNIKKHPQYNEIEEFIHCRGKEIVVLCENQNLLDIGGILVL